MQDIKQWVEELVSSTHQEEEGAVCVVEMQQGILLADIFVRGSPHQVAGV